MSYLEKLFGLNGKVAVVTGGGRGIGQVVARGLARAGAESAIISRTGADETVKLIEKEEGRAYSLLADVTKEAEVDAAMEKILQRSGKIDIVFNNAGVCIHKDTLEARGRAHRGTGRRRSGRPAALFRGSGGAGGGGLSHSGGERRGPRD